MSQLPTTLDGMQIDDYIEHIERSWRQWGNLNSHTIPMAYLAAVIAHMKDQVRISEALWEQAVADLTKRLQEAENNVVTEQRRVNACTARETKLRKELAKCRGEKE